MSASVSSQVYEVSDNEEGVVVDVYRRAGPRTRSRPLARYGYRLRRDGASAGLRVRGVHETCVT